MNRLGIQIGLDLRSQSMPFLQQHFGNAGAFYITGSRAASTTVRSAPTASASPSARHQRRRDSENVFSTRDALAPIMICVALPKGQYPMTKGIRLLGVTISALSSADTAAAEQLPLAFEGQMCSRSAHEENRSK
jgi:hypothetical protein